MLDRLATLLVRVLAVHDGEIQRAPGAGRVLVTSEPDGTELVVASLGDALDVYQGRQNVYAFSMTPETARRLGRFLTRWWVVGCWCGVKPWLWGWALGRAADARLRGQAAPPTVPEETSP